MVELEDEKEDDNLKYGITKKKNIRIIVGSIIAVLVIFLLISVFISGALLYIFLREDPNYGDDIWDNNDAKVDLILPPYSYIGSYDVSWSSVPEATTYTLLEDDNSGFSSPTVVYMGSNTSLSVAGKTNGTYYYRVKASNSQDDGDWSQVKSIKVEIGWIPETEVIKINGVDYSFVTISPGSFMMGSLYGYSNELPVHEVNIGYSFQMGKFEVTQAQWFAVMGADPWSDKSYIPREDNNPAVFISYNDCQDFVSVLNSLDPNHTYRLPSEAEWEYCARAGSDTEYCYGDDTEQLGDYAWYYDNAWAVGEKYAHEVGTKLPNAWGLYDMHGNVWEWCQDWYHDNYNGAPDDGSAWDDSGSLRVVRGGSWSGAARYCRSADRSGGYPGYSDDYFGIRLVRIKA